MEFMLTTKQLLRSAMLIHVHLRDITYVLQFNSSQGNPSSAVTINVVYPTNTPMTPLSVNFWADNTTLMTGQCTNLHWSVTGSGINGVYIGNQAVSPISSTNVCLSSSTTYVLQVNSSQGNRSSSVTINIVNPVIQPPNDGYDPGVDLSSSSFVGQVQAASAQDYFKDAAGNCTWFVASRRPDVIEWLGKTPWNAYLWAQRASDNGGKFGVYVGSTPQKGDIAVWPADCGGTYPIPPSGACTYVAATGRYEGCGHVAYIDKPPVGNIIHVEENNWTNKLDYDTRTIDISKLFTASGSPCHLTFISPSSYHPNPTSQPSSTQSSCLNQPLVIVLLSFWGQINVLYMKCPRGLASGISPFITKSNPPPALLLRFLLPFPLRHTALPTHDGIAECISDSNVRADGAIRRACLARQSCRLQSR